jgi:DNA-binding NarL/FixJ family response regulator
LSAANNHRIAVLVCAEAAEDLARLEEIVRAAPRLRLVGSHLGYAGIEEVAGDAQPDVLLAQAGFDSESDAPWIEAAEQTGPAVLLVAEGDLTAALRAMRGDESEIRGVLPESASDIEITAAIEGVAAGLLVIHPDVAGYVESTAPVANDAAFQALSPREAEILNLLAAGLANKEIAWQLKISEHTVKFHVASLFHKLNASTRAEAVAIGARQGLILF